MATRILMVHSHLARYQRENFRSFLYFLRYISNQNRGSSETANDCQNPSKVEDSQNSEGEPVSKWLNIKAGIYGPKDYRLPLPGDVGLPEAFKDLAKFSRNSTISKNSSTTITKSEFNLASLLMEKDLKIMNALEALKYFTIAKLFNANQIDKDYEVEFDGHLCPAILMNDFELLFPDQNFEGRKIFVMTICQKSHLDMSTWSEQVEEEREFLTFRFVQCAQYICNALKDSGFWADFIDPSSGRPSLGPYTSSTFFETDERYRHFGLTIEDLGCCKVIRHQVWGSKVFTGAIITDAPCNDPKRFMKVFEGIITRGI